MGTATERPDDSTLAAKCAAVLGVVFTVAALGLYGGRAGFSVAVGAVIAVLNLVTMRAIIRALLQPPEGEEEGTEAPKAEAAKAEADGADKPQEKPEAKPDHAGRGKRGGVAWGVFGLLKILILFGGVWLLLTRGWVDPIALVVGYGVLPLGITASALVQSMMRGR